MELENLKEAWAALDNRLKRSEELNESILLEEMRSKAGKIVNRFIVLEMISFTLMLFLVPFCIYAIDRFGGKFWSWDTYMIFFSVLCFLYLFWSVYKIHGLMKFDIAKNVGNNILCMNSYNIQLKREKKVVAYIFGPIFVVFGVISYAAVKAPLALWTFLICAIIFVVLFSYWSYKKYNKSFESVIRSMEEISELKEE